MTTVAPDISILFVSYNVKQYLLHAIDRVTASKFDGTFEIIVTDNNSFDNSAEAIRRHYPQHTVIENDSNVGFGKAVNQAAAAAKGRYLLILNPDTIIEEDTLACLYTYLETHPEAGLIGPKILNADGSLQPACKRSFPTPLVALPKLLGLSSLMPQSRWAGKYNLTYLDPDQTHKVDAVSGSCMFLRSNLFSELGGFDTRFFMFGEDLDLCYQVNQAGYEVHYVAETKIIHFQGESVKSAPYDSHNAFYQAMILFSEKHFSFRQRALSRLFIKSGISLRKTVAGLKEFRSQILSILFDVLAVILAFTVAIPLRFTDFEPVVRTSGFIPGIYIVFWVFIGSVFQLYSRYILSYSRALMSSLSGFFMAAAFTYIFKQFAFSRLVIIVASLIILVIIPGWRILFHYLISRGWFRPVKEKHNILFSRKTLIVGTDDDSLRIAANLVKRFDTGLDIIGLVDQSLEIEPEKLPLPFVGQLEDIRGIVRKYNIREIIFPTGKSTAGNILSIMEKTKDLRLTYRMVPRHEDILLGKASTEELGEYSFVNIEYTLYRRLNWTVKRIFDISVASVLLVLTSPIYLIMGSRRQAIEFWGTNQATFRGYQLNSSNELIKSLPLLLNIIKGNMSLVGSALVSNDIDDPELICHPGLTGIQRLRHIKFAPEDQRILDRYYVQNHSFTLDLEILMKTIFTK